MAEIASDKSIYRTVRQVAESEAYRLYLCTQVETERQYLLQIASAVEYNGEMQRLAFILEKLEVEAERLEKEYEAIKKEPNVMLNYGLGFPELIDSFVYSEQGGRMVNILAFRNVNKVSQMVPLSNIASKDRQRIDLRTSAWIMGKLLKMLSFAHSQSVSVGLLSGNNILIEPNEHYVVIFDWLFARMYQEIPEKIQQTEISEAAKAVFIALGGDPETGLLPEEESDASYTAYLQRLVSGDEKNAQKAHKDFYDLVDKLWVREYHPFTSKPR